MIEHTKTVLKRWQRFGVRNHVQTYSTHCVNVTTRLCLFSQCLHWVYGVTTNVESVGPSELHIQKSCKHTTVLLSAMSNLGT